MIDIPLRGGKEISGIDLIRVSPFKMPQDKRANLLMIGTGTGVAPFRAFIQSIYRRAPDWQGQVRLFYGARTGMDLFYLNDEEDDLANYYDEKSFRAFKGLISKPLASDDQALRDALAYIDAQSDS